MGVSSSCNIGLLDYFPAYAKKLLNNEVKHPESRVPTPQPAQSSPETGGSLSQAVKIGTGTSIALGLLILCVVVFKYREKIARRLRSNSSPSRSAIYQVTSQDDTDAPIIPTTLSSSACSVPRKIHGQETEDGRCGTQAIALIGKILFVKGESFYTYMSLFC